MTFAIPGKAELPLPLRSRYNFVGGDAYFTLRIGGLRTESGWRVCRTTAPRTPSHHAAHGRTPHRSSTPRTKWHRRRRPRISGRSLQPCRSVQRRVGRRRDFSADDSHGFHPGEACRVSYSRTSRPGLRQGPALCRKLALHSAPHDFENRDRRASARRLSDRAPALGQVSRRAPSSGGAVDVRPRE